VDGRKFLFTARLLEAKAPELRSDGAEEAAYRSAINRAYYACYLETNKLAMNDQVKGKAVHKNKKRYKGSHTMLVHLLADNPDNRLSQLGVELGDLYDLRIVADYEMEMSVPFDQTEVLEAIKTAENYLTDLADIDPPDEIRRLILAFLR
jgi:uncharacterized protein (UPF0332 family)